MRTNLDDKALADPRFARLGARLKMNRHEALGRCVPVWMQAYRNRSSRMSLLDIDALSECAGFAKAMIAVDLAQVKGKAIRLRGVDERIGFLKVNDLKLAKANATKLALARQGAPARILDERSETNPASPGTVPEGGAYSLALTPSPSQEQPQAAPLEKRQTADSSTPSRRPVGWEPPGGKAVKRAEERVASGELDRRHVEECWAAVRAKVPDIDTKPPATADKIALRFIDLQEKRSGSGSANGRGRAEQPTDEAYEEAPWSRRA